MDDEWNGLEWAVDGAAALVLGSSAGWTAAMLLGPAEAWLAAVLVFALSLAALRGVPAGRYRLAAFAPAGWEPAPDVLELTEALPGGAAATPLASSVVRLFPVQPPLPSAGQMRESIERHLRQRQAGAEATAEDDVVLLGADASAALRHALGELKRSLG